MTFAIYVITLDTSSLRNRGLAYAFASSPNVIVAYAGPNVAEKFCAKNWRWTYGAFAVILPVFAAPMVWVLLHAKRQAKKKGLLPPSKTPSGRAFVQNLDHYAVDFDRKSARGFTKSRTLCPRRSRTNTSKVFGTFLLTAGLVVFLLPFNIHDNLGDTGAAPASSPC